MTIAIYINFYKTLPFTIKIKYNENEEGQMRNFSLCVIVKVHFRSDGAEWWNKKKTIFLDSFLTQNNEF